MFYLGMESVELGLIDELGDKDDGIAKAKELSGITDGSVKEYGEKETFWDSLSKYMSFSSFYIGQGIGSVLVSQEADDFEFRV